MTYKPNTVYELILPANKGFWRDEKLIDTRRNVEVVAYFRTDKYGNPIMKSLVDWRELR